MYGVVDLSMVTAKGFRGGYTTSEFIIQKSILLNNISNVCCEVFGRVHGVYDIPFRIALG